MAEENEPDFIREDGFYDGGWVEAPEAVAAVVDELEVKSFGETEAAGLDFADTPEEIFGWLWWEKTTGRKWDGLNQGSAPSCVGFGTTKAAQIVMAFEVLAGEPEEVKDLCPEITYGGSRVNVNGGRSPFRGGGSTGAWGAKFITEFGVLARGTYLDGKYDFTSYSAQKAISLGNSGVPKDLLPIMAQNKMGRFIPVYDFESAYVLLAQGYAIQVASNRGFRYNRDKDGYFIPSGIWNHSMCFIGGRRTGRKGLFCDNSWPKGTHNGEKAWDHAPDSGGMVDADVVDYMLRQKDSYAFASFAGFKRRRLVFT